MRNDLNEFIRFMKFGIVGIVNTLINWIIFFVLNEIRIYYITANIIAYLIATANSYFWNFKWVFKYEKGENIKASLKFISLNLLGLVLNTIMLYLLVDLFHLEKMISLIITTAIIMIINYSVNKLWVFKSNISSNI